MSLPTSFTPAAAVGAALCEELPEFETTALLTWQRDEYLEGNDPGVDFPWQMSVETRRAALAEMLREAVYSEAMSDGAEVEERR